MINFLSRWPFWLLQPTSWKWAWFYSLHVLNMPNFSLQYNAYKAARWPFDSCQYYTLVHPDSLGPALKALSLTLLERDVWLSSIWTVRWDYSIVNVFPYWLGLGPRIERHIAIHGIYYYLDSEYRVSGWSKWHKTTKSVSKPAFCTFIPGVSSSVTSVNSRREPMSREHQITWSEHEQMRARGRS